MNILSSYVYQQYLINVKKEARKFKEVNFLNLYPDAMSPDELESWIYYLAMSSALSNLEIYLMDNYPNTLLEYLLERQEKDCLRDKNIRTQYLINENTAFNTICYNAELLYELDKFEQQLTIKEIIYILKEVLKIEVSNHKITALLNY